MRLPIRNRSDKPIALVIEPHVTEYELPPGAVAAVLLEDGLEHSIDVFEDQVTVWNQGGADAEVRISPGSAAAL